MYKHNYIYMYLCIKILVLSFSSGFKGPKTGQNYPKMTKNYFVYNHFESPGQFSLPRKAKKRF